MSYKDAPPWIESPFGKAKLHDNPLFKSSPADNLTGEEFKENCGDRGDNYKNNSGPGKVSKVVKSSPLTKTSGSKRVLGERKCSPQQQRPEKRELNSSYTTNTLDEPPKTIRALSYPSVELLGSSSSSSSEEETSPASRFQVCLSPIRSVTPTRSVSSGEDDFGEDYDPKLNLLTSRPRFLRYRPDWRLEFLNSLELAQGESLLDALDSPKPEVEEEDQSVLTGADPSVEKANGETPGEAAAGETETGDHAAAGEMVEPVEMNARPSSSESISSGITLGAVLRMMMFGGIAGLVFLAMMDWLGLLSSGNLLSGSGLDLQDSSPWSGTGAGYDIDIPRDGWEWHPEYDSSETHSNQTVFEVFSRESEELDGLLMAIMYGSDEEIQHRYLELMEYEREYEYFDDQELEKQLLDEAQHQVELENDADSSIESKEEEDATTSVLELNPEETNTGIVDDELGTVIPIDAVRLREDLNRLRDLFGRSEFFPAFTRLALVMTVILGVACAGYLFSKSWSPSKASSTPVTPSSKVVKPRTSEDLVMSPESLKQSPYGSFTAYKRTVVNEGSKDEHIKLTPVRRSSRIQTQQQTPPVKRRILLSPA